MAEDDYDNERVAAVGAFDVFHAAMEGALWGLAFPYISEVVGIAAGI